mmetsp:Transcript_21117/g.38493  ORF Transcript_21117/g.38493 Transcript_21117/m.38493 type:complete len:208 (-) Transcript_21117:49-672(-)
MKQRLQHEDLDQVPNLLISHVALASPFELLGVNSEDQRPQKLFSSRCSHRWSLCHSNTKVSAMLEAHLPLDGMGQVDNFGVVPVYEDLLEHLTHSICAVVSKAFDRFVAEAVEEQPELTSLLELVALLLGSIPLHAILNARLPFRSHHQRLDAFQNLDRPLLRECTWRYLRCCCRFLRLNCTGARSQIIKAEHKKIPAGPNVLSIVE